MTDLSFYSRKNGGMFQLRDQCREVEGKENAFNPRQSGE